MPKLVVSPAQALLLLMDKHQKNYNISTKLKQWYLSGIEPAQHAEFKKLCSSLSSGLIKYEVSFAHEIINNDPTKRYFETHLAHRTVQHSIDSLDAEKLKNHINQLNTQLDSIRHSSEPHRLKARIEAADRALQGTFFESDSDFIKEYGHYIAQIDSEALFGELKPDAREKIKLMAQATLLGVINTLCHDNLPLNIYGAGMYHSDNKGKVIKKGQKSTRNQYMGLMKSHMAVPRDDTAYADKEAPLTKPSDLATYRDGAAWVEQSFDKLVHPYSNSISGTMLCQLRNLAFFKGSAADNFTQSPDEFINFIKIFIGTMLYGSGGHSLHEFSAPLQEEHVAATFKDVSNDKPLTMHRLFMEGNEAAFDKALSETNRYNSQILKRALVNNEFRQVAQKSKYKTNSKTIQNELAALKNDYKAKIDKKHFKLFRFTGRAKYQMISKACISAIDALENKNPDKAAGILSKLKTDLEKKFGKTASFGDSKKGFAIIDQLEQKIQTILDEPVDIKPSNMRPH